MYILLNCVTHIIIIWYMFKTYNIYIVLIYILYNIYIALYNFNYKS